MPEQRTNVPVLLSFEVSDTGAGIPIAKQQEIFEPFTRNVGEYSKVEGLGLGLAITKKLSVLMKGRITVESIPGRWSIFKAELPFTEIKDLQAVEKADNSRIKGIKGKPKRILLIDDNVMNLSMLESALAPLGFNLETAENGKDGLQMAQEIKPDLILMDFLMPVMDGHEALLKIKGNKELKKIKIIGVSAAAADKEHISSFAADCDDFVSKPVDFNILLKKIKEHLGLEWIIKNIDNEDDTAYIDEKAKINFPPKSVKKDILKAADIGDFRELETILERLAADGMYTVFCKKIREFIKNYDDELIINFINAGE